MKLTKTDLIRLLAWYYFKHYRFLNNPEHIKQDLALASKIYKMIKEK